MEHQVDTAADASISTNPVALPLLPHMSYVHGVAFALTKAEPTNNKLRDQWIHANKVCRHTIISTLSNELFDVYCPYKEAKQIWDSMTAKYTAEDVGRQKFVIGNYNRWEMSDDKEIKTQINEYHKLVEDLKAENINLHEEFLAGLLIEKLPESWNNYKQQLKHKDKQLSLADLIVHIIIEDTTHKEIKAAKAKEIATRANLTLALNDVLHVPNIWANLVSIALLGKVGVKVSFESDKIVMTKNN
ncbi:hypothetical protein EUGRSUZ_H03156, partial [Eucalyptus grandis]